MGKIKYDEKDTGITYETTLSDISKKMSFCKVIVPYTWAKDKKGVRVRVTIEVIE